MATAGVRIETVTKTVEVEEEQIALTMSKDEAETLRDVLGRVGGNLNTTRRKHAREVLVALTGVLGASVAEPEDLPYDRKHAPSDSNTIYFKEVKRSA